jgi:hypothetical protein
MKQGLYSPMWRNRDFLICAILLIFALVACNLTVTVRPEATPVVMVPPDISGEVSRGQPFESQIVPGLFFRLLPIEYGWEVWVGDASAPDHDFSRVVTPPFQGLNARSIEGWHFRNSDNSAPNEPGVKNVNAPQHKRRFCFVLNESDYQTAQLWLDAQQLSAEVQQTIQEKYNLLKSGSGLLTITRLRLGNLVPRQRAWIERMQFQVEFDLESSCHLY